MTNSSEDRNPALEAVRDATERVRLSDEARARIARRLALESARGGAVSGSTTLRPLASTVRRRFAAWIAAAAAVVLLLVWLVPTVDRSTTVLASEVLGRSQQMLAATRPGIEKVTYDLALDGVLQQLLPQGQAGRFMVEETVDHDHPGRVRIVKLASDGSLAAGLADDPVARTRARYIRFESRGFLLRFTDTPPLPLSLASARRVALQVLLGLMQSSANPSLREIDRNGEAAYEIVVPALAASGPIVLERARAVIGREDARLLDIEAAGSFAARPFAVTFNMRSREVRAATPSDASAFTIVPMPGDEVLEAPGTSPVAMWDVISQCLGR